MVVQGQLLPVNWGWHTIILLSYSKAWGRRRGTGLHRVNSHIPGQSDPAVEDWHVNNPDDEIQDEYFKEKEIWFVTSINENWSWSCKRIKWTLV